jgi:hypothetical protein
MLELKYGIRVNYEDPVYQFDGDLVDRTDPAYRIGHPGAKVFVPRGGSVSWPAIFRKASGTLVNPLGLLQSITASHVSNGNPGVFAVREQNGIYFIVPTKVKNAAGHMIAQSSPLDVAIALEEKRRSGMETLHDILQALSRKAGVNVAIGTVPANFLLQTMGTIGASNEAARSVLLRAFDGLHWNLSTNLPVRKVDWRLYYDPNSKDYTFNAHVVTVEKPTPAGGTILRPL